VIDPANPVLVPVFQSTVGLLVWLLATVLMPVVVGLVTKATTNSALQSLALVGLSLVNGLLGEALAAGDGFAWGKAILQAVVSFVIAVATHYGVWRPTGVTAAALAVGTKRDQDLAA
jgi:hypothetical protein